MWKDRWKRYKERYQEKYKEKYTKKNEGQCGTWREGHVGASSEGRRGEAFGRRHDIRPGARLAILAAAFLTAGFVCGVAFYQRQLTVRAETQQHLAQEVLRFHVLANSDDEADQQLKIEVRDAVLAYLEAEMPGEKSGGEDTDVERTKEWMRRHVDEIEKIGAEVVGAAGYDYTVNAAVTTSWFPDKTYGDVTFPAGNYEALRIEIGAAKGHNWWCVLYPGLCFLDAANAVVPDEGKEELRNVLTEEEYERVTLDTKFEIKWFFLDFLNRDSDQE